MPQGERVDEPRAPTSATSESGLSRAASAASNLALGYPLIVAVLLYLEWFAAWNSLGHPPTVPFHHAPRYFDHPVDIHTVTYVAFFGLLPVAALALSFELWRVTIHRNWSRLRRRAALGAAIWGGLLLVLWIDLGGVFAWWWD